MIKVKQNNIRKCTFTILLLILTTGVFSQSKWLELQSRHTGETLKARVVLPPGYDQGKKHYPVLYFLHGWQSSPENWNFLLDWDGLLASLCNEGKVDPFILVLPDSGDDGESWYSDYLDGRAYSRYLIEELIPAVDRTYRTIPKARGIGGFSMGGYGAYKLMATYPHLFSAVSSVSGMLSLKTLTFGWKLIPLRLFSNTFRHLCENVFGTTVEAWRQNDPLTLLVAFYQKAPELFRQKAFYIAVGTKDEFFAQNQAQEVADFLESKDANFTYRRVVGARHNFFFLRSCLESLFQFHSDNFATNFTARDRRNTGERSLAKLGL